jgi:hypothetical protein
MKMEAYATSTHPYPTFPVEGKGFDPLLRSMGRILEG